MRRVSAPSWTVASIVVVAALNVGCHRPRSSSPAAAGGVREDHGALASRPADSVGAIGPALGDTSGMVLLPGGTFTMGTDGGRRYEGPAHRVTLRAFWIDRDAVTVAQFADFVAATGYVTDAERYGWSGVFDLAGGRWTSRDGADWRHPDGPDQPPPLPNEPVTQVSWHDAAAYTRWAGKRLPTEAEWEYGARGGLVGKTYAWGDSLRPGGRPVANWWQGHFPDRNTGEDGFVGRAPVGSFPSNGYGLRDMAANVWQWAADWYTAEYSPEPQVNPTGPGTGIERVLRGGSFLCAQNFCQNFRVFGRSHAAEDTGLNNVGFRCARDATAAEMAQAAR